MNKPNLNFFYELAKRAYASFIRELVKKAIDDPEVSWDDIVLKTLDGIFDYHE